jgi:membrane protein implicated in regulation of membrane protease activity
MDYIMIFVWLAVVVGGVFCEAMTVSLVAIWFVPAALISLLLSLFGVAEWIQVLVFFLLAFAMIVVFRHIFKKRIRDKQASVKTNTDRLLGKRAVVTEEIDNLHALGAVKIDGQEWSARSEGDISIPVGTTVEILAVAGVKLICKPIQ